MKILSIILSLYCFLFINIATGSPLSSENRLVKTDGSLNTRDIGGYRTANGHHILYGVIYRSSELSYLTDNDIKILERLKIHTIVDFRSLKEVKLAPDRLPPNTIYLNVPVMSDKLDIQKVYNILKKNNFPPEMFDFKKVSSYGPYYRMLTLVNDYNNPVYIKKLGQHYKPMFDQLLALPKNQAILFHCTGGRDRTGVGIALLMYVLGVPENEIENNFLESNVYLQPDRSNPTSTKFEKFRFSSVYLQPPSNIKYQKVASELHTTSDKLYSTIKLKPEYLRELFSTIKLEYGSMENFMRSQLGLDDEKIKQLRQKFTY